MSLIRSLPGGRLKTAIAKLAAICCQLIGRSDGAVWGQSRILFGIVQLGAYESHDSKCPALMRCTMQITVGQYLFRFLLAKWAGAFVMGLWVMLAALIAKRAAAGWVGALALPLAMYGIRAAIPATSHWNVVNMRIW